MPLPARVLDQGRSAPTFAAAIRFWLKLGFISFGGPAGQIAIMHAELVERKRWIGEGRFLHALNFCMLLPGPEAQQLAVYIGWLLHRTWGGIVAGTLFVLPGAIVMWALSWLYAAYGQVPWVVAVFAGLKPAVLAIVLMALRRIAGNALKNELLWALAAGAFVAIFFFRLPFPLIVLSAGVLGFVGQKWWPEKFVARSGPAATEAAPQVLGDETQALAPSGPSLRRALKVLFVCGTLWWLPVLVCGLWLDWGHLLVQQGVFFSKAAMVTFGGAYAVLPYVAQQAVERHGWLGAGQMLDGLGLAETTPGPLILVLEFVGFLAGWNRPEPLSPLLMASLGALITVWTTFVPCFLWIFLGAPSVEELRGQARLAAALSAITASVVGVVLNLAVWFGLHVMWPPGGRINFFGVVLCGMALLAMWRWKWEILPVVFAAGLAGLVAHWIDLL